MGRARRTKKTRWSVRALDVASRWVITVGGIGSVAAVSMVFVLLLWVALPLLRPASVSGPERLKLPAAGSAPLRFAVDEYRTAGWLLGADGTLRAFRLDTGETLLARPLFPGRKVTAATFATGSAAAAVGFADGSVAIGTIGFATSFLDAGEIPERLRSLAVGATAVLGEGVAVRISADRLRVQRLEALFAEPLAGRSPAAVRLLDQSASDKEGVLAILQEDGALRVERVSRRENLLTGEVTLTREETSLSWRPEQPGDLPMRLLLSENGDSVTLAFADGRGLRLPVGEPSVVPERVALLGDGARRITDVAWLLGRTTLLAGDDAGGVRAWFPARVGERAGQSARAVLVAAHEFPGSGSPVTALGASSRTRLVAIGRADGTVEVRHVTSEKILARLAAGSVEEPVRAVVFAPKDDGIAALTDDGVALWDFDPRHPETTVASLFLPVWYEGAERPRQVWQSSAATDDFEPKYGLVPLIFGTIKATVYSLLFGFPIAILAAVYTSEFLPPRTRMRIKPLVELMASLPSVVLGFMAALVIAPLVAGRVPAVLATILIGPLMFLLGARLWQLLPGRLALRLERWRFPAMFLAIPVALVAGAGLGPVLERFAFGGDIIRWLDGQIGGAAGAWAFFVFPAAGFATLLAYTALLAPRMHALSRSCTRARCALADLAVFLGGLAVAGAGAALAGLALDAAGLDPRGSFVGTYVSRNSLVVGFVMGFAIIPVIYTLAEDALAAVPDHLRSASLSCGATPWQTAWRIVIPTAMSGLFSAAMIGLGRAVGETMIVLMAAGNTPLIDWNVFNGFRTLSANIAVELPEAVRNSTHYRTLFLAALVLFAMTFCLNTLAEVVRIRYRKKASAL